MHRPNIFQKVVQFPQWNFMLGTFLCLLLSKDQITSHKEGILLHQSKKIVLKLKLHTKKVEKILYLYMKISYSSQSIRV